MESSMTQDRAIRPGGILLGVCGLVAVLALDQFYWHTVFFWREVPNFSPGHVFRSLLIFLSVMGVGGGLVGGHRPEVALAGHEGVSWERIMVFVGMLLTAFFPLLYRFAPEVFELMAYEDGPVETGSFILLIAGSMVLAIAVPRCRGTGMWVWLCGGVLAGAAVVFFVIGMEEVSWLQRVVGFSTPEGFAENLQREFNLHNFATNITEYLYYCAAFVLTVVLPFARSVFRLPLLPRCFPVPLPRPFVAVLGCAACVYTYDMWNGMLTQVMCFAAIGVLLVYARWAEVRVDRCLCLLMLCSVLLSGCVFLFRGGCRPKNVEANEYRELLMPLAMLAYAVSVFRELGSGGGHPVSRGT